MQISYFNSDLCCSCSNLLKKAKTATIMANIQLLWKLFILQAMHNYQRTSMFIGHFALTPERWSIWAEILYWGSYILRLGLVRISAQSDQKNVGYPEDRPLCKGTKKQGGGRIIQMKICSNSYNSVPLILVILRTILFANHHLQRNGGAQRRPNHVDDQLQQSVLFRLEIVAILRFLLLFYSIFTPFLLRFLLRFLI